MAEQGFIALGVAVLTVSDTRTTETDTSGTAIVESLSAAGHQVVAREIVADDSAGIRAQVETWLGMQDVQVIISTGGTGITARDVTPEALAPFVTKSIPGFGELFRALSHEQIGAATIQSRALAAVCGSTLVFALPGSTGAVHLALDRIILPQLDNRTRPCNFAMLLPRLESRQPAPPTEPPSRV